MLLKPKASIKDYMYEPTLLIIPFGIAAYGFVGQPFSKQLYLYRVFSTISPVRVPWTPST